MTIEPKLFTMNMRVAARQPLRKMEERQVLLHQKWRSTLASEHIVYGAEGLLTARHRQRRKHVLVIDDRLRQILALATIEPIICLKS